jgi:hypothetical protein
MNLRMQEHHVLPPNVEDLAAGNLTTADCLLPLQQLRDLTLTNIEFEAATAEELRQLSSLTALTNVSITYNCEYAEEIDAAAGGWRALKLKSLSLSPCGRGDLARETLLLLRRLTDVVTLQLSRCRLHALAPELLASCIKCMHNLCNLTLEAVCFDPAAEDAAALGALLHGLRRRRQWHWRSWLTRLSLKSQPVSRAAAAALSKLRGLQTLQLERCQLEDCCAVDIALGLEGSLQELDVQGNLRLTDGCLPALVYVLPGLQEGNFRGCTGITLKGLQRYLQPEDSNSDSDSDDSSDSGSDGDSE